MKFIATFLLGLLLHIPTNAQNNNALRSIVNKAFQRGEKLTYRVHYGLINAGEATLEVLNSTKTINGRPIYHVAATGKTLGAFNAVYKVDDRYDSFIDEEAMVPWAFMRRVQEGNYIINQDYFFNHYKHLVKARRSGSGEKVYGDTIMTNLPDNIQDMISAFYQMRTIDMSFIEVGDLIQLYAYMDEEIYPIRLKFLGKEEMKTDIGKVKCLKFVPVVQKGRVFKDEQDLKVWITDDENKIPVRVEAEIIVGSIKIDITQAANLRNPLPIVSE